MLTSFKSSPRTETTRLTSSFRDIQDGDTENKVAELEARNYFAPPSGLCVTVAVKTHPEWPFLCPAAYIKARWVDE